MKKFILPLLALVCVCGNIRGGEIDRLIAARLVAEGIGASPQCDAETFVRRCFLVATDRIPTEAQTMAYLAHPDREALVDSLLASEGFVEKQVLKWGDMLRIKSEFPSCMWPNAVQAFNKWLTLEFRANTPYNEFVKHLLSGTGSNFRVPQTNFYRAGNDRSTRKFTSDIALIFLGRRNAPAEWKPFFSQIKFKSTKEWKEEILCIDIDVKPPFKALELGGRSIRLREGADYRQPFIEWLTTGNRELARVFANRLWFWLMGEGIISPVDDVEGREPTNAALLEYLTDTFIASGWNVRALAREILTSDAFARSSISCASNAGDTKFFSHFIQSRLTAEQICDAICDITGVPDLYSSRAPEPFTNFPPGTRANQVCDGTITTPQLDIFGRPSRDVALESGRDNSVNAKQILYLLNSMDVQNKLERSPFAASIMRGADLDEMTDRIYLRVLTRHASQAEKDAVRAYAQKTTGTDNAPEVAKSLIWALVNTDEFLFMN